MSRCEYPHVVVTGASSGAGRAVTLCLAAGGYHVYAGVRAHADGIALHQHTPPGAGLITPLLLDVSRPVQVMAAARAVTAHAGPAGLDGLVNHAGLDGTGWRPEVNVTAELAVTRAFVPLLCRSAASADVCPRSSAPHVPGVPQHSCSPAPSPSGAPD
jgi:NAD(P)-dependent dehydrogenase (short-subunit alcohol dehydrogenase family)